MIGAEPIAAVSFVDMSIPIFLVDAFAERPLSGNPAAVCLLDAPAEEAWMQSVAMEMNQAETAFVRSLAEGFELRWFTPTLEVDLCGHATLASAHVLWETGRLQENQTANFHTKSGQLSCAKGAGAIELDFPATPPIQTEVSREVACALDLEPTWFGESRFDFFVEVRSERDLRELNPDPGMIARAGHRGVIVTSRGSEGTYDFVSRFFAPNAGVPEDSVTGSTHCALAPYWSTKLNKQELTGYQASKRGGYVGTRFVGDRVVLRGKATTTVIGELRA